MQSHPELADHVERELGALTTAATVQMSDDLEWFRELPAEMRALVGMVAHAGITMFVRWLRQPTDFWSISQGVFGAAPRTLARAITLQQTVELVRVTVDVVEQHVPDIVDPADRAALHDAVLRYSREVAFAVAQVYAAAAEERGAWHTRLRTLLVDALLRDEPAEAIEARAAALGWRTPAELVPVVGPGPTGDPDRVLDDIERHCRGLGLEAVAAVQGGWIVLLAGGDSLETSLKALWSAFPGGPVVVGDIVSSLREAGAAARAALSGARVVASWPTAPLPVRARALLPERALAGDSTARDELVRDVYEPLRVATAPLLETVSTYLDVGGSVEAAARALFLHPNTVRYRLRKASEETGLVATDPRDAYVLRVALTLGRLDT